MPTFTRSEQLINFLSLFLQFFALLEVDDHLDMDGNFATELTGLIIQYFKMVIILLDLLDADDNDDDEIAHLKPHQLLRFLAPLNRFRRIRRDVYAELVRNYDDFWWMVGETESTFECLHEALEFRLLRPINGRNVRETTIDSRNRLLMAMIWMRRYPVFPLLAFLFGISESLVCHVIHFTVPILHTHLVPRFIRWPTAPEWNAQAGTYPHFPGVVGMLDGSVFRILKPTGWLQRLFYRRDKHFHFVNWILVTDTKGFIVFSRVGFPGRMHDSLCYR